MATKLMGFGVGAGEVFPWWLSFPDMPDFEESGQIRSQIMTSLPVTHVECTLSVQIICSSKILAFNHENQTQARNTVCQASQYLGSFEQK